ncbi:cytochrome P450 3A19 [Paraphoma chrysanthemicola]|uniref:Cytochrome P450 3A19 n=1 Tax=Paraphoma chrysanthemicola TaxID=798071 RepID=A0A8K0W0M1_9PLEO|nr:cytochrome P450 3A19 [Paraphoma chrysanthemicola]
MSLITLIVDTGFVTRSCLALAAGLWLYFLYNILVVPRTSSLRHLPSPNQGSVWLRLFHEPRALEVEKWVDTIQHNGLFRYHGIFNRERIFVASPDAVKDFLTTSAYKFIKPELQWLLANNVTGTGLLILEGNAHKEARKGFNPAFSPAQMKKGFPSLWKLTIDTIDGLPARIKPTHSLSADTNVPDEGVVSIMKLIAAVSIDMFGKFGYGVPFDTLNNIGPKKSQKSIQSKDPKDKFGRAYVELFKMTKRGQATLEAASLVGAKLALKLPIPAVRSMASIMGLVRQTAEDIVINHEKKLSSQDEKDKFDDDMLSIAMKSGNFTHQDLVTHTIHFFAAGTETTAATICWAIHLLSRHPDVQSRLRDEVRANITNTTGDLRDAVSDVQLRGLKYLNAVVQEVLRFHQPNTFLWRECIEPASIAGVPIPKGKVLVYSPWTLSRDPAYWGPDARSFRPERWLESTSGGAINPSSFLPFGAGPRRCIGEQFARDEMICLIAGMIGRYEFTPIAPEKGTDHGREIGDDFALTLFKIYESWELNVKKIPGW